MNMPIFTTSSNDQANPVGQSGPTGGEVYPQRYVDALNSEIAKLRSLIVAVVRDAELVRDTEDYYRVSEDAIEALLVVWNEYRP